MFGIRPQPIVPTQPFHHFTSLSFDSFKFLLFIIITYSKEFLLSHNHNLLNELLFHYKTITKRNVYYCFSWILVHFSFSHNLCQTLSCSFSFTYLSSNNPTNLKELLSCVLQCYTPTPWSRNMEYTS